MVAEMLIEELEERNWSADDLARHMGTTEQIVQGLLSETLPMTDEIAEQLSRAFGTSALIWVRLSKIPACDCND